MQHQKYISANMEIQSGKVVVFLGEAGVSQGEYCCETLLLMKQANRSEKISREQVMKSLSGE